MNGWEVRYGRVNSSSYLSWHVCLARKKNILLHQSQSISIFLGVWMRTSSGSLQFSGSRQVLMRRDRAGSWDTFPWFSEDSQDLIPAKCQWKCPSYLFFLVVSVLMPVAPLMRMQSFLIWKERVNVMGSCDDEVWWRLMIFLSHLFWSLCEWIYE